MPSASIIRSDKPEGPADEMGFRCEIQKKRTDPEAELLNEFLECKSPYPKESAETEKFLNEKVDFICEKLGDISFEEFLHKLDILVGRVEDDEREWREKKYGTPQP